MDKKIIVFYDDNYDGDILIWKADKEYNILSEQNGVYCCESESSERVGIDKTITNMFYIK